MKRILALTLLAATLSAAAPITESGFEIDPASCKPSAFVYLFGKKLPAQYTCQVLVKFDTTTTPRDSVKARKPK